ncbi:hypothetical protein [Caldimonas tepidiphila]|uniref:hypothetical protein n=1 Tax=Caldimonas tepidiphila TaxID=2315841 RepID=UPI000E5B729D|nr:hypothetical protein [Caldimonas tepidiphila]
MVTTGNIAEISRCAGRVGVRLSGGRYAVCRLLDGRRGEIRLGEPVAGALERTGAGMMETPSSGARSRVLVLALYDSAEAVREMVHN